MINLFEANKEDADFINNIYNQNIAEGFATADTEPVTLSARTKWIEEHQANQRPIWIIYAEHTAVGWISLSDFYSRSAYRKTIELSVYIDEIHKGKGFAKAACQWIIENAGQLDIENILVFVFAHNEPSLNLFKKLGFEEWGFFPEIANMPQAKRSLVILGLKVAQKK